MAVRSLGQLTLDLVARVGGFTGPMDQASRAAKKDMADIANSFKGAATAITATSATVAAAGGAIVAMTKTAADNARTLQNQAQVANASVEEFQRMAYATQSVQVEQDKLAQILQDVNDRVGEFLREGSGEMAAFFEEIAPQVGVTAEQFRNLSGPQALQLYYDSLEKANFSQAEMTAFLEKIASDTTALIPLLRDGGQGFADMATEADELGIVLSELDIAKLDEFGREFDRINGILATTGQLLAAELSPYLSAIGSDLVELAADGDGFGESVRSAVESSLEVIGYLSNALHGIEVVMKGMRAAAFSVGQAYTAVFAEITNAATFLMDQVAGAINSVIEGLNHLPGVDDIPLISSFQDSSYAQGIRALRDEMAGLGEEARREFVEKFNEPLPKTVIDEWISEVRNSTDELAADIALPGMTVTGSSLPNAKDREAAQKAQAAAAKEAAQAAKEAAREAERLADAQQSVIDRLYPAQAAWRQYHEDMRLLELRSASDATLDLADAQRQLNNELSVGLTGGFMEQVATGGLADELENTNDIAKDLGLTFSSAFEDAIVGGEGFRDVLAGITEDIARLAVRKSITEPAANWLGTAFSVGLSAFGGGSPVQGGFTSAINTGASFVGQAHDGIDRIPREGTWLLDGGERVMTAPQADKLDRFLASQQFTPAATAVTVNAPVHVTAEGGATMQDGERQGRAAAQVIKATVLQVIQEQQRQGGLLDKR